MDLPVALRAVRGPAPTDDDAAGGRAFVPAAAPAIRLAPGTLPIETLPTGARLRPPRPVPAAAAR